MSRVVLFTDDKDDGKYASMMAHDAKAYLLLCDDTTVNSSLLMPSIILEHYLILYRFIRCEEFIVKCKFLERAMKIISKNINDLCDSNLYMHHHLSPLVISIFHILIFYSANVGHSATMLEVSFRINLLLGDDYKKFCFSSASESYCDDYILALL